MSVLLFNGNAPHDLPQYYCDLKKRHSPLIWLLRKHQCRFNSCDGKRQCRVARLNRHMLENKTANLSAFCTLAAKHIGVAILFLKTLTENAGSHYLSLENQKNRLRAVEWIKRKAKKKAGQTSGQSFEGFRD